MSKYNKLLFNSVTILGCVALLLYSSACVKVSSNGLMEGASPGTSALALYYYDDGMVNCSYIYDSKTTQKILGELNAVKASEAKGWSLDDITLPIYGFWISATDGSGIFAAWSNNHWVSRDGTAYSFNFDFKKLEEDYPWADTSEFASFSLFPCARFLTQDENGWNSTLLTPAGELDAPDGVTMALNSWDNDTVSVNIANNSGMEWMYGEYYSLQVLLDGSWYEIPPIPGHWGFNDIGLIVQDGEVQEKTYYLAMYGKLPEGTYRLVAYGLSVEKVI